MRSCFVARAAGAFVVEAFPAVGSASPGWAACLVARCTEVVVRQCTAAVARQYIEGRPSR